MAKRKYKTRGKKSNNSLMVFFIIVIVLALLSLVISYFIMETETDAGENVANTGEITTADKITSRVFALEGTWASYNDGAMLTITGRNFTIELPSVESTATISGKIVISDKTATFVNINEDSDCGIKPGAYKFVLQDNDEVTFIMIDDSCNSRSSQLVATWFRV